MSAPQLVLPQRSTGARPFGQPPLEFVASAAAAAAAAASRIRHVAADVVALHVGVVA